MIFSPIIRNETRMFKGEFENFIPAVKNEGEPESETPVVKPEEAVETPEAQAERVLNEEEKAFVENYREKHAQKIELVESYLNQILKAPDTRAAVDADLRQSEEYKKFLGINGGSSLSVEQAISNKLSEYKSYKENPEQMSQALEDLDNLRRVANDYLLRLEEESRKVGAEAILEKIQQHPEVAAAKADSEPSRTVSSQSQLQPQTFAQRLRGFFGGK